MGRGINFPLRVAAEIKSGPSSDLKNPSSLLLTSSVLSRDNGIGEKGECFNCAHCFGLQLGCTGCQGGGASGAVVMPCMFVLLSAVCQVPGPFYLFIYFFKKTLILSFSMLKASRRLNVVRGYVDCIPCWMMSTTPVFYHSSSVHHESMQPRVLNDLCLALAVCRLTSLTKSSVVSLG